MTNTRNRRSPATPRTAAARTAAALLLLAGCAAPGAEVRPDAGDFAFLEVHLRG